jgi:hypothetical protein
MYVQQTQQGKEDGCLHGDATERTQEYRFRQMEGVRGKCQADREQGDTVVSPDLSPDSACARREEDDAVGAAPAAEL